MRWQSCSFLLAGLFLVLPANSAFAGMPAPLPTNIEQVFRVNDSAMARLQTLSFFLGGFLLCAAVVRWLWHYLQRDFPKLPQLTYGKALAGVFLCSLLFVLVLPMISVARYL